MLVLIALLARYLVDNTENKESKTINDVKDPVLIEAEPYVSKIRTNDIELRSLASSVTKECNSGDKECQLNKIYRYIVEDYNYYSDPRDREFIQTPNETMKIKGGDCEDLTILMSSLLENIGFNTYLVLTDDHAYSLACGVNTDKLWDYIQESITKIASEDLGKDTEYEAKIKEGNLFLETKIEQTFELNPGGIWYYGGDGSSFTEPIKYMDIEYSVSSSDPVTIYFVPSKKDYEKLSDMQIFNNYPSCEKDNIYKVSDSCDSLDKYGGIIILNKDYKNGAKVDIKLTFSFAYSTESLFSGQEINYYELGDEQCVVLEATAGKYGFPGYDSTTGRKIAVDPITKEYYNLK